MADNVAVDSGTGITVATDEVRGARPISLSLVRNGKQRELSEFIQAALIEHIGILAKDLDNGVAGFALVMWDGRGEPVAAVSSVSDVLSRQVATSATAVREAIW
jgi:hypothetical protein